MAIDLNQALITGVINGFSVGIGGGLALILHELYIKPYILKLEARRKEIKNNIFGNNKDGGSL